MNQRETVSRNGIRSIRILPLFSIAGYRYHYVISKVKWHVREMSLAILSALPSNPPCLAFHLRHLRLTSYGMPDTIDHAQWFTLASQKKSNEQLIETFLALLPLFAFLPSSFLILYVHRYDYYITHDRNLNLLFTTFDNAIVQFSVVLYNITNIKSPKINV